MREQNGRVLKSASRYTCAKYAFSGSNARISAQVIDDAVRKQGGAYRAIDACVNEAAAVRVPIAVQAKNRGARALTK